MRRSLLRLLLLAVAAASLGACATSAERTWVHPETGALPPPAAPDGR